MDQVATEGLRLTNFNVEVQCTPSRSAIMTGRHAIRSGNGTVPMGEMVWAAQFNTRIGLTLRRWLCAQRTF